MAVSKIKSRGNSFSCIYLRTPADSSVDEIFFFLSFFHKITSNSFCPIFLWSRVHASRAKALSGLGLIPIPKCFTANVITSSWVPQFKACCSLPVVVFHFQVSFPCHPLIFIVGAILKTPILFRGQTSAFGRIMSYPPPPTSCHL